MTRIDRIDVSAVLRRVLNEGPDGLLTRGEAAALIASRTKEADENMRAVQNRVGMQIDRACGTGSDRWAAGLPRTPSGHYKINDIVRLARGNYPGLFDDLPYHGVVQRVSVTDSIGMGASTKSVRYEVIPGSYAL